MNSALRDWAKALAWAITAALATVALYRYDVLDGWGGLALGAVVAGTAAYRFHKSPRVGVLTVTWCALFIACACGWLLWALSDFQFRAPGR